MNKAQYDPLLLKQTLRKIAYEMHICLFPFSFSIAYRNIFSFLISSFSFLFFFTPTLDPKCRSRSLDVDPSEVRFFPPTKHAYDSWNRQCLEVT